MLIAIDIGNTEINVGVFDGEELKTTWHVATVVHRTSDEHAVQFLNLLASRKLKPGDINKVALCCVVPQMIPAFVEMFKQYFGVAPLVVAAGIKTGMRINMDNPREVGADRIADAVAAHELYGQPVIVVDLGTATTFDTISKEGDYIGGAIAPGMLTAAEAMFQKAAMLPHIELARPAKAIGANTIDAMKSGIVFGYVALVEGMVARIQKELGARPKVVATGGFCRMIAAETRVIDEVNPNLTLIGLRLIHRLNQPA
jgi:type III pantothenate kinase